MALVDGKQLARLQIRRGMRENLDTDGWLDGEPGFVQGSQENPDDKALVIFDEDSGEFVELPNKTDLQSATDGMATALQQHAEQTSSALSSMQGTITEEAAKTTRELAKKVALPAGETDEEKYGAAGQVAFSDGEGGIEWRDNVPVDESLTNRGQAADAAAAGSRLRNLQTACEALQTNLGATAADVQNLQTGLSNADDKIANCFDSATVSDDGLEITFWHGDTPLASITGISGGGGGGGGGDVISSQMEVHNTSGWAYALVAPGSPVPISISWTSTMDGISTGAGIARLYVNSELKESKDVAQGDLSWTDVSGYFKPGTNSIRATVTDVYGKMGFVLFTVKSVVLTMSSRFDSQSPYDSSGTVSFPYMPTGEADKVVCFEHDGDALESETISVSGKTFIKNLPAKPHGVHTIKAWCYADVEGTRVNSNTLYYEYFCVEDGNTTPLISSTSPETGEVMQYGTVKIDHRVLNPAGLSAAVEYYVNGDLVLSGSVDRSLQSFTYRCMESGSLTIMIKSGSATRTFTRTVTKSEMDIIPVTENRVFHLSAIGRSNTESNPYVWEDSGVDCAFEGFTGGGDGWGKGPDGKSCLILPPGRRLTVNTTPFSSDPKRLGAFFSVKFRIGDVIDKDAVPISCYSGERGLLIGTEMATFKSAHSEVKTFYGEDDTLEFGVSIQARRDEGDTFVYMYLDGEKSQKVAYPQGEDFSQLTAVPITIGSDGCTTYIYDIKQYSVELSDDEILRNLIADEEDPDKMLELYDKNNILNDRGEVDVDKLPSDLPVFCIRSARKPDNKKDYVDCSGYFTDKLNPGRSFTWTGGRVAVQGTSSVNYDVKNENVWFDEGVVVNGIQSAKWAMDSETIPVNILCLKANVASSEGVNNIGGAGLYEHFRMFRTPGEIARLSVGDGRKLRNTVNGFPCVMVWDTGSGVEFVGLFNVTISKYSDEVFTTDYEQAWEHKENDSENCNYISSNFDDYDGNFEAEFEAEGFSDDISNFATYHRFVTSCNPDRATNSDLAESVTYNGVTFTRDTADYRKARFKALFPEYVELDSYIEYYIMTTDFHAEDSRSKNLFVIEAGAENSNISA